SVGITCRTISFCAPSWAGTAIQTDERRDSDHPGRAPQSRLIKRVNQRWISDGLIVHPPWPRLFAAGLRFLLDGRKHIAHNNPRSLTVPAAPDGAPRADRGCGVFASA